MKKVITLTAFILAFVSILASNTPTKNELKALKQMNLKSYSEAEEKLIDNLKIYRTDNENAEIHMSRHGRYNDGGYVVPEIAFTKSDVLLGYGIADDPSFEIEYSKKYNKPSYGFDCGVQSTPANSPNFIFLSECIDSAKYLYKNQQASNNISSFSEQINRLKLNNKKLFIKMDIEGAEYQAFEDIKNYHQNITGIVLEIHFIDRLSTLKALKLLEDLNKHFYLIHIHGNNCINYHLNSPKINGKMPRILELTFINKNLTNFVWNTAGSINSPAPIDMPNCKERPEAYFSIIYNK